ncbi:DUF1800 domain-containing protein [Thalassotalea sp. PLHSN55]|uniref:DUF1800 domain-containing protein n=1 Tax=Thalassotalea sp. PLHSN55 TaxID=3435888 RepID=UPI003F84C79E
MSVITNREQAVKFLYRATYGPKQGDAENLLAIGEDAWFEQQFNLPVGSHAQTLIEFSAASWTGSGHEFAPEMRNSAWLYNSIAGEDQLRQRMAFALSQIFVVGGVGNSVTGQAQYYDLLLNHAFGNFRDLLSAVTLSPMMGRYLSLAWSKKYNEANNSFPDENYAREVMQLFTIGLVELDKKGQEILDENGNTIPTYGQNDIEELARVLTGWRVSGWIDPMYAQENDHDFGEKVVMGKVFPANQTMEQDLNQALDLLFNHKNTPVFIAKALIKRFTLSNPTSGYVKRVANIFIDNGQGVRGDMKAVLKAIMLDWNVIAGYGDNTGISGKQVKLRHFGKAKEPLMVMTNFCRALDVTSRDPSRWWDPCFLRNGKMGQAPLEAPSVFNFYSPDHVPEGEFSEKGLTAPEFELLTMENLLNISNNMLDKIIIDVWGDDIKNYDWDQGVFLDVISQDDTYLNYLNERIFFGQMPQPLEDYLASTLADMSSRGLSDAQKLEDTLFIIQCSPEFRCQE